MNRPEIDLGNMKRPNTLLDANETLVDRRKALLERGEVRHPDCRYRALEAGQPVVQWRKVGRPDRRNGGAERRDAGLEFLACRQFFKVVEAAHPGEQLLVAFGDVLLAALHPPPGEQRAEHRRERQQKEDLEKQEPHCEALGEALARKSKDQVGGKTMRISMRRLRARPASLALSATG